MKGGAYYLAGKVLAFFLAIVTVILTSSAWGSPGAFLEFPISVNYSRDTIGAKDPIWSVAEDPAGRRLFAGADKLFVFDGANWSAVGSANTKEIRCIAFQAERIWVGGINELGYFSRASGTAWKYTSATGKIKTSLGVVWSIYALPHGAIVAVTDKKVILLSDQEKEAKAWELPNDRRLSAQQTSDGIIVLQRSLPTNKLWIIRDNELTALEIESTSLRNHGFDFLTQEPGRWIFNAGRAIIARDAKSGVENLLYQDEGEQLRKALVSCGLHRNGWTYLGTIYGGLFIISDEGRVLRLTREQGMLSERSNGLAQSRANGIWVATESGVTFVHDVSDAVQASVDGSVKAIDANEREILVATNKGISSSVFAIEQLPSAALAVISSGDATYASVFSDIYLRTSELAWRKWLSLPGSEITGLLRSSRHPEILFATNTKGITKINTSNLDGGLPPSLEMADVPTKAVEDQSGTLWVSTMGGVVATIDSDLHKSAQLYKNNHGLASLALHRGRPIILFEEGGFFEPNQPMIKGTADLSDPKAAWEQGGPAWIYGRSDGAHRIGTLLETPAGLRLERKNIPSLQGIKRVTELAVLGSRLFIGGETEMASGLGGLIEIKKSNLLLGPELDPPAIEEVLVRAPKTKTSRTFLPSTVGSDLLYLTQDESELTITLERKLWGALEKPVYESRLTPLEEEWTTHPYGQAISHHNLPPGEYKLLVRTRHLGLEGEPMAIPFSIAFPWYMSVPGVTMISLLAVLAFFGAVGLRTRQMGRKNQELEARIEERTRELAKANATKTEFLAAMSHEIRNPMNGVVGIIKMLKDSNLGTREKYLLSTLHRCSEQLRTTVDDVLDFSKIEAGEVSLHLDAFDLYETITSTISAADVGTQRLDLSTWAGTRPVVKGDQGKLTQILTNYLANAVKYGIPPRATVDIFVLEEGQERCRVTIAVKSSGPDIPSDEIGLIFESFQRGESAKTRRIGGAGLGLAICKRYALAMGGQVAVVSANGSTMFSVTLPFERVQPLGMEPQKATIVRKLHARALAIEDEDYNRLVLADILNNLGYEVSWAPDGESALRLAKENAYDVILTDLQLPDTTGIELAPKLLAVCGEPKPPIFAITAYSTREKKEECIRAGMANFISKPITSEKLELALKGWAHQRIPRISQDFEEETEASVLDLESLRRVEPLEVSIPKFTTEMKNQWDGIISFALDNPHEAANRAHRLLSLTIMVRAISASERLRVVERLLREDPSGAETASSVQECGEEIAKLVAALKANLRKSAAELAAAN